MTLILYVYIDCDPFSIFYLQSHLCTMTQWINILKLARYRCNIVITIIVIVVMVIMVITIIIIIIIIIIFRIAGSR